MMETVNEVENQDSNNGSDLEKEISKSQPNETPIVKEKRSFHSMIKWSVVFAFITTYTHFFGFSFVKGKLQAAGFYSSDISLDVNETLHEAAAATQVGLFAIAKHFFSEENFQTALVLFISLPTGFLIVANWSLLVKLFSFVTVDGSNFQNKYVSPLKKLTASILLGGIGFALPYLITMIMVFAVSMVWLGMSIGQNLGEMHTELSITNKVCKPLSEAKGSVARECMIVQLNDGSILSGHVLHQEKDQLFFLTNNGSYLLNDNLVVQYSACIHRKVEKEIVPLKFVTNCMARCEPSCQKESKEANSPTP